MKRLVMLLILFILLAPLVPAGSEPLSSLAPLESPAGTHTLSADGDESSESITSFSETLADDVLFYPDLFLEGITLASSGSAGPAAGGTYEATHVSDGTPFYGWEAGTGTAYAIINFTATSQIEGFTYGIECAGQTGDDEADFLIYDWTADDWVQISVVNLGAYQWENGTTYNPDYWGGLEVSIKVNSTDADDTAGAYIDYGEVCFYVMHLGDSGHYTESFADVSDWTLHTTGGLGGGDYGIGNDGDVGEIWMVTDDDNNEYVFYKQAVDFLIRKDSIFEIRFKSENAHTSMATRITGDGLDIWPASTLSTTFVTSKAKLSTNAGKTADWVYIFLDDVASDSTYGNNSGWIDYWRLCPTDEMGWQHDGSTTEGFGYQATRPAIVFSSDGDLITCNPSGDDARITIDMDTTTTQTKITENYQFVEFSISGVTDGDADGSVWRLRLFEDDATYSIFLNEWSDDTGIFRYNFDALTVDGGGDLNEVEYFKFYMDDEDDEVIFDYVKLYSIANYTVTQHSSIGVDEYFYVDSEELHIVKDSTNWMLLGIDPLLSVAVATYTIWNITTPEIDPMGGALLSMLFKPYVGGSEYYYDTARGGWAGSGTFADFSFTFYADVDMKISAVKFIEDSTAPDILDKYLDPSEPYDDEPVTITAVTYDAVEVYEVTINAVVYPAGFDDIDYEMTETAQADVYTCDFSTLTAGYYLFQIKANDGANTYDEYISVRVREAAILLDEISFFGVGEDFSMMTFSFKINKDCSYSIYEESAGSAESETHTGSVTEGMNNIAWTKLSVTDTQVNFTLKFTNGTLTKNVTGQYSVAQVTFAVNDFFVYSLDSSETVKVTGHATKLCTYVVKDDDGITHASGTITDQDFTLTFSMWGSVSIYHNFTITFTNGTNTVTKEGAFYRWENDPDTAERGGAPDPDTRAALQVGTWTLLAVAAVGIGVISIGRKEGNIE